MDNLVKILDSEKTLHALREIERNPQITQRDLAHKLDISLGKLNFLIRALIDKGIIEIKNFKNSRNKLAYTYLLTTQGIKIKIHLTRKFFAWKAQEYEELKKEMERLRAQEPVIISGEEPV
ncbi:MAG: MarR family EPS-associated transcriptional regulator [Candidatus Omnitrophota bacterium]|jgi:EPS-associated MarR family transcriptional regulator